MIKQPLELPYIIDTRFEGRLVAILLPTLPLLFLAYFLITKSRYAEDQQLLTTILGSMLLLDLLMFYFIYRGASGFKGLLNHGMLTIEPDSFLGIQSAAPKGTFTGQHFEGLKLVETGKRKSMRAVKLMGRAPVPTLSLGTYSPNYAEQLARFVGNTLKLPQLN